MNIQQLKERHDEIKKRRDEAALKRLSEVMPEYAHHIKAKKFRDIAEHLTADKVEVEETRGVKDYSNIKNIYDKIRK